jgi:uncharacterized repeat protein (TIGR01451 family)
MVPRLLVPLWLLCAAPAWPAGTTAGTVVDNVAVVDFDLGGISSTQDSNTASFTVLERIDVDVTLQSAQVAVAPNQPDASLLFTVTNTGNGSDIYRLAIDSALSGDDFDPQPAVPAIYFDSDASGDFTVGDVAYEPGVNDPALAADGSIDVLLVNNIPAATTDGQLGRSGLTATSTEGAGAPGAVVSGGGDGGIDAVIGASGGDDEAFGEYLVSDVNLSITKSVVANDPFGGNEPTVGATLSYTINVAVTNGGTATASVLTDPVPTNSTYVANSLSLNGINLTDAIDLDAGELDSSGAPTVVVRLGDLTQADGVQIIEFQVTIN